MRAQTDLNSKLLARFKDVKGDRQRLESNLKQTSEDLERCQDTMIESKTKMKQAADNWKVANGQMKKIMRENARLRKRYEAAKTDRDILIEALAAN